MFSKEYPSHLDDGELKPYDGRRQSFFLAAGTMLLHAPSRRRFMLLALVVTLLLSFFSYFRSHLTTIIAPDFLSDPDASQSFSSPTPEMTNFWRTLMNELYDTQPPVRDLVEFAEMRLAAFDPKSPAALMRHDLIRLSEEEVDGLQQQHDRFAKSARDLASSLPYAAGSTGIVMTADPEYMGVTITSMLMLRRSGSRLPVQVFLNSATSMGRRACDKALEPLNARCVNMDDFFAVPVNTTAPPLVLESYQFKVFALIFSSFQNLLFLDADAFPLRNPDRLLRAGVEPLASHGLVTFPDFWLPTVSPLFWKIARLEEPQVTLDSRASESGIILMDKARHGSSLLMAAYYNTYGPGVYYHLQSQGAWGMGDKETFLLGAMATGNPAWQVRTYAELLSTESVNDGSGIRQFDPEGDFHRVKRIEAMGKARLEGQIPPDMPLTTESASAPGGTKRKQKKRVTARDEEPRREAEDERQKKPQWMFAHLNRVKIDARAIENSVGSILYDRGLIDGHPQRLWGPEDAEAIQKEAGFDVERAVWNEIIAVACKESILRECDMIKEWYQVVFGSLPPEGPGDMCDDHALFVHDRTGRKRDKRDRATRA